MTTVTPPRRRIGLLGGTFDPPHAGHLHLATHAQRGADLDEVWFVVANDPWQKRAQRPITPAHHRLAMCRLAVADRPDWRVSDVEIGRGGPSYTIDTVEELERREHLDGRSLVLVVGSDAAAGLDTWHRAAELRGRVEVVVVARPGHRRPVPPGWRVVPVAAPPLDVSSSALRAALGAGDDVGRLVPEAVAEYARRHHLYGPGGATADPDAALGAGEQ